MAKLKLAEPTDTPIDQWTPTQAFEHVFRAVHEAREHVIDPVADNTLRALSAEMRQRARQAEKDGA